MNQKNPRKTSTRKVPAQITDLPDRALGIIFANCSSTDMTRCSLVNRKFREFIEDLEDERSESLRSSQKAKIFICDRKRAILEGVSTITPTRLARTPKNSECSDAGSTSYSSIASTSSSGAGSLGSSSKTKTRKQQAEQKQQDLRRRNISDRTKSTTTSDDSSGFHSKATAFISDQYSDPINPHWAFDFDFAPWLQEYDVTEVFFKNFCSFLEREKIEDPMSPSSYKGRTAFYENHNRDNANAASLAECQITDLSDDSVKELKSQSAGRIERLVERLANIRNAHFTFKDSICYGARPPATIFYFLSLMRENLRAITFDHVQSATKIDLHKVLTLENINKLTVNQPQERQSIFVNEELFKNWMKLADPVRKVISVHLIGCQEFRPQNLYVVVQEWLKLEKPVEFKQISIDGGPYKYNDFMDLIERLHDVIEQAPPRSPTNRSFGKSPNEHTVVLERTCQIPHPKDRRFVITFKYCKLSRKMVLTIEKHNTAIPRTTLSSVPASTRLIRPQSAASVISSPVRKLSASLKSGSPIPTNNSNGRQLGRPLSHDPRLMTGCRENAGSNVFTRIVSFLGTSS